MTILHSASLLRLEGNKAVDRPPKTPDHWLSRPINHLDEANNEQEDNTDYKGPDIFEEDMKVWNDFFTAQDIVAAARQLLEYRIQAGVNLVISIETTRISKANNLDEG